MPRKSGIFTKREQVFLERVVATHDPVYAAEKAGYGSPAARASQALSNPAIIAEIHARQLERLRSEAGPLGLDVLMEIAGDKGAGNNARVAAGKELCKMAGYYGDDERRGSKEPHEMDAAELAAAIERLQDLKASRAKPVLELTATEGSLFD